MSNIVLESTQYEYTPTLCAAPENCGMSESPTAIVASAQSASGLRATMLNLVVVIDSTQPAKDDSDDVGVPVDADDKCACPNQGCDRKFRGLRRLRTHVRYDDDFTSIPCPRGCDPSKLFDKKETLQAHIHSVHEFRGTICCLNLVCLSEQIFNSQSSLMRHLRQLSEKGLTNYIRPTQAGSPVTDGEE